VTIGPNLKIPVDVKVKCSDFENLKYIKIELGISRMMKFQLQPKKKLNYRDALQEANQSPSSMSLYNDKISIHKYILIQTGCI
jgi:hypothetical protein